MFLFQNNFGTCLPHVFKLHLTPLSDFKLRFTPCKAKQPLRGMEFQEKEEKDDKDIGKLFRKHLKKKGVYQN